MSFATLSGIPVVTGRLVVPYSGPWHADLLLSQPIDIPGPQTLLVGTDPWTCSYVRQVDFSGERRVRVVAGLGGWRKSVDAKQYGDGTIMTLSVVTDAALACGEPPPVLGPTVPPTVGSAYCRQSGKASLVLQDLFGDGWWVDKTGIVQVSPRLAIPIASPFQAIEVDGSSGIYEIATNNLAEWMPGCTFFSAVVSGTVSRVTHVFGKTKLRTEVMVS